MTVFKVALMRLHRYEGFVWHAGFREGLKSESSVRLDSIRAAGIINTVPCWGVVIVNITHKLSLPHVGAGIGINVCTEMYTNSKKKSGL